MKKTNYINENEQLFQLVSTIKLKKNSNITIQKIIDNVIETVYILNIFNYDEITLKEAKFPNDNSVFECYSKTSYKVLDIIQLIENESIEKYRNDRIKEIYE